MAQNSATPTAEQFENFDEQAQNDLKHDAWSQVAEEFASQHPGLHDRLDRNDAWDEMELEIYEDEHGRKYFHRTTGVVYAPGHRPGKKLHEAANEFLNQYRERLSELVRERDQ